MQEYQAIIEQAWEDRANLAPGTAPARIGEAVSQVIERLDKGELRVAEKINGHWHTHQWIKKAVLLSFRLEDNQIMDAGAGEAGGVPACELGGHLVIELCEAAGRHRRVVVQAERQQHGLLHPLVHEPLAVALLGDAQVAGIEAVDHVVDGAAQRLRCGGRAEASAVVPRFADGRFEAHCVLVVVRR